jgi:type IV pilus assembly protein PilV
MNNHNGFTLIELLIAMLVLGVGLLGLASLQAKSLSNTQLAYNRSLATELAYDLADRMRANNTPNGLSIYPSMLPANAIPKANCVTVSTLCPPDVMAQNDLYEWNLALVTSLPSGQGIVCLDNTPSPIPNDAFSAASYAAAGCDGLGSTYAIKIWWDDDRSGAVSLPPFVVGFKL